MRSTDFMLNLSQQLIKDRNIAESTATQYLQTLWSLNGKKPFNNLAFTKNTEEVQKIIDTYAKSTQASIYIVLASVLSLFANKATYKKAYTHWNTKMLDARKEANEQPKNEKTEKQADNWITWEDVQKKAIELSTELSQFVSNKTITTAQYDKLLSYVVLSLYCDIAPRRNADYLYMYVVKKLPKEKDLEKDKNYYDLSTQKFVFFVYKTAKTYNKQEVDVPESLQKTLATFLKFHPLAKGAKSNYKLLVKHDGSPINTVNAITRILNKVFDGKKIGSSMLRHIYLSSKYGDTIKEMQEDSAEMGHSTNQQKDYIKN